MTSPISPGTADCPWPPYQIWNTNDRCKPEVDGFYIAYDGKQQETVEFKDGSWQSNNLGQIIGWRENTLRTKSYHE